MKLSFVLILASVLQVSAHVNGQSSVTVQAKNEKISHILNMIERQGNYRFLFNSRLKDLSDRVSIDVTAKPITETLQILFAGSDLKYKILENDLVVVLSSTLAVQDQVVTGKVTGETGESLPNISIAVKGTSKGTTSNNNGDFTISVPAGGTLIFSYIGYQTQEIKITDQTVLDLKMVKAQTQMDQVVVVGYGSQRKLDVTGAIATVSGAAITKQPVVNAISGLQGKVAGVQITNLGEPGKAPLVRIRGLGTFYASANPLYVVDGVWFDDVQFLNPADIESVNILKDASSEAIYGIRGANGVILITTNKGKRNGRATVNYNGYVGWQVATNQPPMANANQYATMFNELQVYNNGTNTLDPNAFGTGTPWFDQTLRNGFINNHQVSVGGGGEKSNYNLSVGYLGQQGILKTNDYDRYTAKLQSDVVISNYVKAGFTAIGTYSIASNPPGGIWQQIYTAPPVLPVYFADGRYGNPGYYGLGTTIQNPQATLDFNNSNAYNYSFIGSGYVDISFAKHFTFHTSLGGTYLENEQRIYTPVYNATSTQQNSVSKLEVNRLETRNWIVENTLTYANTFNDLRMTVLVGQNAQYYDYNELHGTAAGVPNINTGNWYLGLGTGGVGSIDDVDNNYNQAYPLQSTIVSYFGRLSLAFKDRYVLNGTIRADGSSKFFGSDRWGYFPSVGGAWIVSKEDFMENQKIFNTLKFKGSWGKVGNVGSPTFAGSQQSVSGGAYSIIYGNSGIVSPGVSVASITPPPLQWEIGTGTDVGMEAAFLDNRLNVEVDYYNKLTQRFIMDVYIPGSAGLATSYITTNVGDLQNRGWEFTVGWRNKNSKDFSYSINANFSINENEFLTNSAGAQRLYNGGSGSTGGQLATISTVGQPIGAFYGYKVIGVFQNQAEVDSYTDKNGDAFQPSAKPGDLKFQSLTDKGPISGNDRQIIGNPNPRYAYGLNSNFTYKNFDFSLDLQGIADVDVYNGVKGLRYGNENWTEDFYKNRWHGAGTSNSYPSVNIGGGQNYVPNSWYVEDGSYFRIRNIQLGYTLPESLMSRYSISKLRVYVSAENPWTTFKYTGFTPEVGGTIGNIGIDVNVYPLTAIYTFGVNLSF